MYSSNWYFIIKQKVMTVKHYVIYYPNCIYPSYSFVAQHGILSIHQCLEAWILIREQKVITCLWSELSGYWDREGYSVKVEYNATKLVLRGGHLISGGGMVLLKIFPTHVFLKKYPGWHFNQISQSIVLSFISVSSFVMKIKQNVFLWEGVLH